MRWFRVLWSIAKVAARWAAALAVAATSLYAAGVIAGLMGWSTTPPGPHQLTKAPQALLPSIALGVLGILAARLILGRRPCSPWLLLGIVPAVSFGLQATGLWPRL